MTKGQGLTHSPSILMLFKFVPLYTSVESTCPLGSTGLLFYYLSLPSMSRCIFSRRIPFVPFYNPLGSSLWDDVSCGVLSASVVFAATLPTCQCQSVPTLFLLAHSLCALLFTVGIIPTRCHVLWGPPAPILILICFCVLCQCQCVPTPATWRFYLCTVNNKPSGCILQDDVTLISYGPHVNQLFVTRVTQK